MSRECHISSLVVHSRPDRVASVVDGIGAIEGAEVHGGEEAGKLIVTLETETENQVVERVNAIQLLDGVLAATLVFHHFEPVPELE
ncbi:nitrate reductase NapD [Microvirga flocculans]|uniref:Chaperone NapD n=1 Tax=Microvirga flocculans TaxID=217168 RepID=A0A7W6IHW5_9HYPH|nr:chaperone NapD [Microvirga flocculans]MBB4041767.1 nitrate reductase NapD [Microvirga flocculans]